MNTPYQSQIKNVNNPESLKVTLHVGAYNDKLASNSDRNDLVVGDIYHAANTYKDMHNVLRRICVQTDKATEKQTIDSILAGIKHSIEIIINSICISLESDLLNNYRTFTDAYKLTGIEQFKKLAIEEITSMTPHLIPNDYASKELVKAFNMSQNDAESEIRASNSNVYNAVKKTLQLSSGETISSLDDITFKKNHITIIKAGMGQGKTTRVNKECVHLLQVNPQAKIAFINYRNALCSKFHTDIELLHGSPISLATHNEKNLGLLEQASIITTSINSLPKVMPYVLKADLIIFDESEKGIMSIAGKHYKNEQHAEKSYDALENLLQQQKQIILLDADTSDDITVRFINHINVNSVSIYKKQTDNIYSKYKVIIQHRDATLATGITSKLVAFDRVRILWNEIKKLSFESNRHDSYKKALDAGILVVCGATKEKGEVIEFIRNPNQESMKYQRIFYSPYLGSGFSITCDFSDEITIVSDNILTPMELLQMSLRFRAVKTIKFAVQKKHTQIKAYSYKSKNTPFDFNEMKKSTEDSSYRLKMNTPLALYHTLNELGFNIHIEKITTNEKTKKSLIDTLLNNKISTKDVDFIENAKNINDISDFLISHTTLTKEQKFSFIKYGIANELNIPTSQVDKQTILFYSDFKMKNLTTKLNNHHLSDKNIDDEDKNILIAISEILNIMNVRFEHKTMLSTQTYQLTYDHLTNKKDLFLPYFTTNSFRNRSEQTMNHVKRTVNKLLKILGFKVETVGSNKNKSRDVCVSMHPLAKRYIANA
ncbi:hypothetical protein PVK64_08915 [Aliivibrio sp. S4TY2]|uniref:Replication origin-binding protein domain-containing protein n=1 Tax=Aliivibrio finisterrensis TaxID=511998 RepID=A0ABY0I3B6_9GAMM|nr:MULTISPECIES: hypothetical protein [Aliivibrio]MDD9156307.1 hypothetical protein [Aliivibrio sp. S4TY2]MDD9160654.1 hypothetical protein [Aliivibrio sp. S4TY1]MDD9164014.1 hypothetical protein [Aliivibrio sp. S4MY2]MDD9168011.1 hypothetical protein [Aliivibrio sp. S4MY4]MDD9177154.1 hypothetical protein [Aliivibrio sp. A6]